MDGLGVAPARLRQGLAPGAEAGGAGTNGAGRPGEWGTVPVQKPRIAIDGYNLALDQGTGVATYARNLSRRLGALSPELAACVRLCSVLGAAFGREAIDDHHAARVLPSSGLKLGEYAAR